MQATVSGQPPTPSSLIKEMEHVSSILHGAMTYINTEVSEGVITHGNQSIIPSYLALFERFVSDTLYQKEGHEKHVLGAVISQGMAAILRDNVPKPTIMKYFIGKLDV